MIDTTRLRPHPADIENGMTIPVPASRMAEIADEIDRLQRALGHAKTTAAYAQADAKRYGKALQDRADELHAVRAVAAQVDGERETNARLTAELDTAERLLRLQDAKVKVLRETLEEIVNLLTYAITDREGRERETLATWTGSLLRVRDVLAHARDVLNPEVR